MDLQEKETTSRGPEQKPQEECLPTSANISCRKLLLLGKEKEVSCKMLWSLCNAEEA
jgi:hypothetical protein